jgi:hypothetical protein
MTNNHPTASLAPARITGDDLRERHGDRWKIEHDPGLGTWSAEHRSPDGHAIRYIVGPSVGELVGKLDTATTVEP